jgi:hypothetical protein
MLVVVSGSFTLAFGADFTFQISGLGLSKCHSVLTPLIQVPLIGAVALSGARRGLAP